MLWPLFGAINQLLATLALIVISLYLIKVKGGHKWIVSGVPALIMAITTIYATVLNQINFINSGTWVLSTINICLILIVMWVIIESLLKFKEILKRVDYSSTQKLKVID